MSQNQATPTQSSVSTKSYDARAFAAASASSPLAAATIRRRAPLAKDVRIEVLFCGVCHSDLHQVRDE
ncbi:MAG: alcohol dehydrogenase catalytic domain-containing protein, partial [Planctomycetes bacterium]|nr:alcohol dehydrogenase catalytic domain-containing protein [Planctomycetota bacterium]